MPLQVRPWSHDVIAWLMNVHLAEIAPSASQARCRQLTCFAAWVRLGAIFEAEAAQLDKLIQLAFQCSLSLDAGKLCMHKHTASSCLVTLWQAYTLLADH